MRKTISVVAACGAVAMTAMPLSAEPFGEESQDVVRQHNAAYTAGDFDRFLATFAEDAVVIVEGHEYRGREAIAASYAPNFGPGAPRARIERQGRASGGGIVQRESYVFDDGTEICCTVTAIWVEDGRISRILVDTGGITG
ncbi:hypothetical protein GCM10023208_26860 [Erythrobacter westpacificensis]|uniref:SnoaL-like domain-containing protein n=1 Tax=Erythrobacter westpacificensis TaxID=1055231 RepID=A0ABP9KKQ3_9SPHN|tara:strand:+ start:21 stop:443 length:423 start_codon:yes stop_codon:yes gene_type:complete